MVIQFRGEIMQRSEINRRQFSNSFQSWFSKRWACWTNNHKGWSKMKKNRRLFKKKFREETKKEIKYEMEFMD